MNRIIETTTVDSVNQTMDTLNKEVAGVLGEYNDLVVSLSDGITYLEPREKIGDLVNGMGKNMIENTMLYYATYEQLWEGGALYTSIGWVPPADFDMQSRLWHKNAVNNQTKVCYTEPYVDANTGLLNITLSYRVLDKNGKLIGIVAADVVLDALSEAVRNIKLTTNSKIHIITKEGLYLTNDDSASIMTANYFDDVHFNKISKEEYLDGKSKAFTENIR
jgi:methyl-accepting chemotaxis protein